MTAEPCLPLARQVRVAQELLTLALLLGSNIVAGIFWALILFIGVRGGVDVSPICIYVNSVHTP